MKKLGITTLPIFFLIMIYVNFLSGTGKINGISAGGVSALYPTYFTPAGFTFSIWGIIYLFNLAFVIYAIVSGLRKSADFPSGRVLSLYILTCLINIAWIYSWHYQEMLLTVFLMILFLITLILIYQEVTTRIKKSIGEYVLTVIPISIYSGWIVIATVANVSVALTSFHWNGFGIADYYWASVMIVLAAIINIFILINKKDIFFSLVFLWAAMGIISARRVEGTSESNIVAVTALISMSLVFLFMLFVRFFVIRKHKISSGTSHKESKTN